MLELKNISYEVKTGGSRQKILDHISLTIKSGLTVITGPNGSGKSTLSSIIMGLKKPTDGQIILDKEDITNLSITDRAKKGLALSFQQPVKFKGITVYDLLNVASGELISEKEAGKYLKEVGLEPARYLLREVNNKLSGGELKRIELASVLARHAKITIFDEPEAGIDLWSFTNLTKVFKKMKKDHRTVIIVSHQERILNIADRIVILENGKIKNSGTPATILPEITGGRHAA
ncbi:ATP-binding cassette domain-containing protein [Candidatus Saccharibacteria bacterium]|nr:ATP-binding cassette domain-containing protein [Candidatus Saccharibacteria bacterium]